MVHRRSKPKARLRVNLSGIKDRGSGIHPDKSSVGWAAIRSLICKILLKYFSCYAGPTAIVFSMKCSMGFERLLNKVNR